MLEAQFVKEVRTRSLKAKAMKFRYGEDREETIRHVRRIEACLSVWISCASDQGALFCHLEIDGVRSQLLQDGDWVVVDAFKKVSVVKDSEFNVYYEPE